MCACVCVCESIYVFDFVLKAVGAVGSELASNAISCWLLPPHFRGVNAKHDWIKTEQSIAHSLILYMYHTADE